MLDSPSSENRVDFLFLASMFFCFFFPPQNMQMLLDTEPNISLITSKLVLNRQTANLGSCGVMVRELDL